MSCHRTRSLTLCRAADVNSGATTPALLSHPPLAPLTHTRPPATSRCCVLVLGYLGSCRVIFPDKLGDQEGRGASIFQRPAVRGSRQEAASRIDADHRFVSEADLATGTMKEGGKERQAGGGGGG